tara:strand:- start:2551 stop:4461 length:1911 start_codon:yes stop_codon:yes gene_type:complete
MFTNRQYEKLARTIYNGGSDDENNLNNSLINDQLVAVKYRTNNQKPIFTLANGHSATLFKTQNNEKKYVLRLFYNFDNSNIIYDTHSKIKDYLDSKKPTWYVEFEYFNIAGYINNQEFPGIKMPYFDGKYLLNRFLNDNYGNISELNRFQKSLIETNNSIEKLKVTHGDIQHGNLIYFNGEVKLIDYDNMYVPSMTNYNSKEIGVLNYQHPCRTIDSHCQGIDRFSIWILLLTSEVVKYRKDLYKDKISLFEPDDFESPESSDLFLKLTNSNEGNISNYSNIIKNLLYEHDLSKIPKPSLNKLATLAKLKKNSDEHNVFWKPSKKAKKNHIWINANISNPTIYDSKLKVIAKKVPFQIDVTKYKKISIKYKNESSKISFSDKEGSYFHKFNQVEKKSILSRKQKNIPSSKEPIELRSFNIEFIFKSYLSKDTTFSNFFKNWIYRFNGDEVLGNCYDKLVRDENNLYTITDIDSGKLTIKFKAEKKWKEYSFNQKDFYIEDLLKDDKYIKTHSVPIGTKASLAIHSTKFSSIYREYTIEKENTIQEGVYSNYKKYKSVYKKKGISIEIPESLNDCLVRYLGGFYLFKFPIWFIANIIMKYVFPYIVIALVLIFFAGLFTDGLAFEWVYEILKYIFDF